MKARETDRKDIRKNHFEVNRSYSGESEQIVSLKSEALIEKAFEDNFDGAVEMLFRWYYAPLCNHAVRFVASREIAEDIVSDVFSACYLNRTFTTINTSFRAYLFKAVRNRAYNYVRSEINRSVSLETAQHLSAQQEQQPDEITHYEDMYQDVEKAINELTSRRRSIYIMHRIEGKKHDEIAQELGISLKTVKEHMYQALRQIREHLRNKWSIIGLLLSSSYQEIWNQL